MVIPSHVSGLVSLSSAAANIGYRVYSLGAAQPLVPVDKDSCAAMWPALLDACTEMSALGLVDSDLCGVTTAFFFAHDTPRCAARVTLSNQDRQRQATILAFDVDGQPINGYEAHCGNGVIDPGEACDDGNHSDWDGCDPSCQFSEFHGCETVIQHYFDYSHVAHVDAATWTSPRTHLMVHDSAAPMRPLDIALCDAANAAAQNVCSELTATMPFIDQCWPVVEFSQDGGSACSVRFDISFSRISSGDAVFTTQINGLLAFSIR